MTSARASRASGGVFRTAIPAVVLHGGLCSYAGGLAAQAASGTPRVAIRAARLVDPASGITHSDIVVLIEGQRIADVLPASRYGPRADDRLIDLGEATVLPGLIDAHVHLTIGGPPRAAALATLKAGFTTVADLGAVSQRIQVVRDSVGAIRRGMIADIIAVPGDPLADVGQLLRPSFVMARGRVVLGRN